MAGTTSYFVVAYDNEATGPFTAEGANLTWTGGVGFIVTVVDDGATGRLFCALVSGVLPTDNLVLTQGTTTADANGNAQTLLFPAYFRNDVSISAAGAVAWTGPALGATHSFFWDGQTANCVVGEILAFSGGQQCEIVTIESDAGASGEFSVRWMTFIDQPFPDDNDTFTGSIAGDGTLNGLVHPRCYTPLEEHRLLSYLNMNQDIVGDDDLSRLDAIPSGKDTPEIVNLLGGVTNSDTVIQHMHSGSVSQASGDTLYSGLNLKVTSPITTSEPVVIKDDTIVTAYWKNAYMPHSVDGEIRILQKTRQDGVDFDGKRLRAALLEYGELYFMAGTTLGTGTTQIALVAGSDGNNLTAVGTVAGAPYNTITLTEGFQNLNYTNGNGLTPFAMSVGFGSANSLQTYERSKYIQRRGTAELLYGRNAQLFTGVDLNWAYDGEVGGPYTEDEILAWGTVITFSGQTTNLTLGEAVNFVGSGAKGRLIYYDDNVATGTCIFAMEGTTVPLATDTLSGITSGGDGNVDVVTYNAIFGTALLCALDDQGLTGNLYTQRLTGIAPVDNQIVYGATSNATSLVNGTPLSRTVNNQFIGNYTSTNYNATNFGMAIAVANAIVGDQILNLLNAKQLPPDNQTGIIRALSIGDIVNSSPWDGVAVDANGNAEPNFNEMTLSVALVAATSTTVQVGTGNIPENTPSSGELWVERDSDNNIEILPYTSHDGDGTFTLTGTAPSAAAIGNTVMRALINTEITAGSTASFSAIKGVGDMQVVNSVKNGGTLNGPIKPSITTATFGSGGFDVNASRIDDS